MVGCWEYGSISYISIPKINLSLHQNENSQQEQNESTEGTAGACSRAMLKVTIVTAICLDYNIGLRSHSVFKTTNLLIHTV